MTKAGERVMVVTAHPDDPEFGAGGTIAKLVEEGREVTYVIVTNGDKGSGDRTIAPERLAAIREGEQREAARTVGVARVEFLGYEDGEIEDTRTLRLDVTRQIRRWRPDLLITQNPQRAYTNFFAWHRDHRVTAGVVLDCVYPLARDHLSFPELLAEYEPHTVREVYLMQWEAPRLVVDITAAIDRKLQAVACHASQIADWTTVESRVRRRGMAIGQPNGYLYAEGFDRIALTG
jgi:LmbE family N-acetylglucosaminyl deacetylase